MNTADEHQQCADPLFVWLLAQIAEDYRVVTLHGQPIGWSYNPSGLDTFHAGTTVVMTPHRAVAEAKVKRRLVERHAPRTAAEGPHEGELICGCSGGTDEFLARSWPCDDVRDLATLYRDRSGFTATTGTT